MGCEGCELFCWHIEVFYRLFWGVWGGRLVPALWLGWGTHTGLPQMCWRQAAVELLPKSLQVSKKPAAGTAQHLAELLLSGCWDPPAWQHHRSMFCIKSVQPLGPGEPSQGRGWCGAPVCSGGAVTVLGLPRPSKHPLHSLDCHEEQDTRTSGHQDTRTPCCAGTLRPCPWHSSLAPRACSPACRGSPGAILRCTAAASPPGVFSTFFPALSPRSRKFEEHALLHFSPTPSGEFLWRGVLWQRHHSKSRVQSPSFSCVS